MCVSERERDRERERERERNEGVGQGGRGWPTVANDGEERGVLARLDIDDGDIRDLRADRHRVVCAAKDPTDASAATPGQRTGKRRGDADQLQFATPSSCLYRSIC